MVLLAAAASPHPLASAQGEPFPAGGSEEIQSYLRRFEDDPARAMGELPPRRDEFGVRVRDDDPAESAFNEEERATGRAHEAKDRFRARLCVKGVHGATRCLDDRGDRRGGPGARAAIGASDRPEDLIEPAALGEDRLPRYRTLEQLEEKGLRMASLPRQPWSGDYWPTAAGLLGARYADPAFPAARPTPVLDWSVNRAHVRARPAATVARNGTDADVDRLSPSEKYELFIGSPVFALSETQWRLGEEEFREKGSVESWMGICHGWSSAALMVRRPERVLSLRSADRRHVLRFYPADLKALSSLLWADADIETRAIGGRCRTRDPRTDANGRVTDPECFDSNPAAWHLAVTHQIGVAGRGFVLDAAMDYRIWNQPALGYRYSYFNPQTGEAVATLAAARVQTSRFTHDKFRAYRPRAAREVVGIVMDFTYVRGTRASQESVDDASRDRVRTIRYLYDLELDGQGRIIGGEWYTRAHPDFLWVPAAGTRAISAWEPDATGEWDGEGELPESWKKAALGAAQDGLPLGRILDVLLSRSARPQTVNAPRIPPGQGGRR